MTPLKKSADLCPTKITIIGKYKVGSEILFKSGISNIGEMDSGKFKVVWRINGDIFKTSIHDNVRVGRTVFDETTSLSWTVKKPGKYLVSFCLDSSNTVRESNNLNNTVVSKIEIKR